MFNIIVTILSIIFVLYFIYWLYGVLNYWKAMKLFRSRFPNEYSLYYDNKSYLDKLLIWNDDYIKAIVENDYDIRTALNRGNRCLKVIVFILIICPVLFIFIVLGFKYFAG
jgi:hypothetical protein